MTAKGHAMKNSDVFSLEALQAMEGDALLLHYGSAAAPKLILIDGGPRGVYAATLKKRLAAIGEQRQVDPLELRHAFVTHLDSDHISGVLDLAKDILQGTAPADCNSFWLNVADKTLLAQLPPVTAAALDGAPTPRILADEASIKDGLALMDAVGKLQAARNGVVPASQGGVAPVLVADGAALPLDLGEPELSVSLVCPDLAHLRKLAAEWQKTTKKTAAAQADYVDNSVFNLSSLVMVVEARHPDGRRARMLLTGDARGDHIIAGLQNAGLLDQQGHAHFDVLKVPHHGSDRNLHPEFFQAIQARHYVISANGRFENPSTQALEWIAEGAEDEDYVLWLTNRTNPSQDALEKNVAAALAAQPGLREHLRFREDDAPSVMIDVFDAAG
jgi:beta-lactamase superfamily II metal-dependent hydrolase